MGVKFILKKDWIIETEMMGVKNKITIFKKGQTFEPNENNEYIIDSILGKMLFDYNSMTLANIDGDSLFMIEHENDLNISIDEVKIDDDEIVKRWRIQLDVTTSRKKLKEIENIINEIIKPIL